MDNTTLLYIAIGSFILILLLIVVHLVFRVILKRKKASIEQIDHSESIPTATPLETPLMTFKSRAQRSVKMRFSIFRRVITIVVLILLVVIFSFPYVDQLPQAIISILVGSAAIITGMAARPFIENFLSGIAITASKMLNIGDTILMGEKYGTIEDISSTHTVIKLWDWRRFVIPNSTMINQEFVNYSLYDQFQWAYVEFFVSYEADIQQVRELAKKVAAESTYFRGIEEPSFWIMDTTKDAIRCWIAAWATSPPEAWEMKADIRTRLVVEFKESGIRTHLNYHAFREGE